MIFMSQRPKQTLSFSCVAHFSVQNIDQFIRTQRPQSCRKDRKVFSANCVSSLCTLRCLFLVRKGLIVQVCDATKLHSSTSAKYKKISRKLLQDQCCCFVYDLFCNFAEIKFCSCNFKTMQGLFVSFDVHLYCYYIIFYIIATAERICLR